MAERLGRRVRPTGMRRWLGVMVLAMLVAGCGDDGSSSEMPLGKGSTCNIASNAQAMKLTRLDLDGDGTFESLVYIPRQPGCGEGVAAQVDGGDFMTVLGSGISGPPDETFAIKVPGRQGEIAVVRQSHPRGGYQVTLVAWMDGALGKVEVHGQPIFPFLATDSLSDPLSAACVENGFEITRARAHEPMGVVHAWDVDRTAYTLDGTTVTKGPTTEVADNVLDKQLERKYHALVAHQLFTNCRAAKE